MCDSVGIEQSPSKAPVLGCQIVQTICVSAAISEEQQLRDKGSPKLPREAQMSNQSVLNKLNDPHPTPYLPPSYLPLRKGMEESYETFEEELGPPRADPPPQKPVRQISRSEMYATRKIREVSLKKQKTETLRGQRTAEEEEEVGLTVRRSGTLRHRRQPPEPETTLWEVMFWWLPDLDDEEDEDEDNEGDVKSGKSRIGATARASRGHRNKPLADKKLMKQGEGKIKDRRAKKAKDEETKDKKQRDKQDKPEDEVHEEDEGDENETAEPKKNKKLEEKKEKKKTQKG
ncbi:hypothetical protein PAMA_005141 [Pampus argenteus]